MKRRKPIRGFGINDAPQHENPASNPMCPFYSRWKGMIERCHGLGGGRPENYKGATISDEWRSFMAFKAWMSERPWQGNHLDKDILRPWEKRYCPETCVFIPIWLNTLLNEMARAIGKLPLGVTKTPNGRYSAKIRGENSKRIGLGLFDTPDEAHRAWAHAKSAVITGAVARYRLTDRFDERVCAALLNRADQLAAT